MNTNQEDTVIRLSKKSCLKMVDFLRKSGLECFDTYEPTMGTKGFIIYDSTPLKSPETLCLLWQEHNPILTIKTFDREDDLLLSAKTFEECLEDGGGWEKCNDPKTLRIGFINVKKSEIRYFKFSIARTSEFENAMKKYKQNEFKPDPLNLPKIKTIEK